MKKYTILAFFGFSLLLVFLTLITISRSRIIGEHHALVEQTRTLKDSLYSLSVRNQYMDKVHRAQQLTDGMSVKEIEFHTLEEDGTKKSVSIPFSDKRLVLVRYSSSGCDKCIEMLLRNREYLERIKEKYDLAIVVDFETYDAFKRWRRSTMPEGDIFLWVDWTTPLYLDEYAGNGSSYIFVVDQARTVHSFFIPNISFSEELVKYVDVLSVSY